MIAAPDLPLWAAIAVGALALAGAIFALTGVIGLLTLRRFYERGHAPTLGISLGATFMSAACVLCFSVLHGRLVAHALLIPVFLLLTAPAALMLLAEGALTQDWKEGVHPEAADLEQAPPPD